MMAVKSKELLQCHTMAVAIITTTVLVPALHVCMPVYTLSVDGALACSCWSLAAYAVAASEAEPPEETGLSSAAVQHLLLAVGTLSLHRVMLRRAPICQY